MSQAVVAPVKALPKLELLDLSQCGKLSYAHILSDSLRILRLNGCTALKKVRFSRPSSVWCRARLEHEMAIVRLVA